jgi:hypothetical protein
MVADALDILHGKHPSCDTLAFADLSTQMILITNSGTTFRREGLDALCAEAALTFGTGGGTALGNSDAGLVIVATADHLRIYLRAAQVPTDALCCVCTHDVAIDPFLKDARACLEQISHGG